MKIKIAFTLVLLLSAAIAQGEVLTATSDPFTFGSPAQVPLSFFALALFAGLILVYTLWRYVGFKRKAV